jgi:hypothetical protein
MDVRWFLFVQLEFPWELGPEDGRYLLRRGGAEAAQAEERLTQTQAEEWHAEERLTQTQAEERLTLYADAEQVAGEPEHVVVLRTLSAARPSWIRPRSERRRKVALADPQNEAAPVPITRATVIDPHSLGEERAAQAWLEGCADEREAQRAVRTLNRVLWAHSIATADPYTRELAPAQALVVRAGWGSGDQVAAGHWEAARELTWKLRRGGRHSAALRPQERLAALLSGREVALLCEEPTLRARRDLEGGRIQLAALELEQAYALAVEELARERREDLATRVAELRELRGSFDAQSPDEQAVTHALGRLEAALRARTAAGVAGAREGS